jgi:hypothetical protein
MTSTIYSQSAVTDVNAMRLLNPRTFNLKCHIAYGDNAYRTVCVPVSA